MEGPSGYGLSSSRVERTICSYQEAGGGSLLSQQRGFGVLLSQQKTMVFLRIFCPALSHFSKQKVRLRFCQATRKAWSAHPSQFSQVEVRGDEGGMSRGTRQRQFRLQGLYCCPAADR